MFEVNSKSNEFSLNIKEQIILKHNYSCPIFYIGKGNSNFDEYRGNYKVDEEIEEKIPLRVVKKVNNKILFYSNEIDKEPKLIIEIYEENNKVILKFTTNNTYYNRLWMRVYAKKDESVYGLGEQMSYFDLRGRLFPILTSEPGVGRDKNSYITFQADVNGKAGGDYYTTNYPEPTYISSRNYWCHVNTYSYSVFDFRKENYHEIYIHEIPDKIIFKIEKSLKDTVKSFSRFAGKMPPLPEWIHDGIILGVQGGINVVEKYLQQALKYKIKVTALFCQDWQGIKITSFGQRLKWNWIVDEERYPDLKNKIKDFNKIGVKFIGYINPNVLKGESLYNFAKEKNFLVKNKNGEVYDVDYGEFDCGIVDLTNPDAFNWFKNIIKDNLIRIGFNGWMADFGEYLPMDCILHNGVDAKKMHNKWPVLWAKCNYEAVKEAGKLGDIFYFMRAGGFGTQKYCVSLWAGDQFVDWSRHDGIITALIGALSSGMTGNSYHHSDIGGYTSLFGNVRTKELFQRWLEMATFTSVMRTHEGNRPKENFQYYQDEETLIHMKKFVDVRVALKEYFRKVDIEGSYLGSGLPMQRPLILHYDNDKDAYKCYDQFLLGEDILVAPVLKPGKTTRKVYIPEGKWVHLWTKKVFSKGYHTIDARIGYIPVFYKHNSDFKELFDNIYDKNY